MQKAKDPKGFVPEHTTSDSQGRRGNWESSVSILMPESAAQAAPQDSRQFSDKPGNGWVILAVRCH